MEINKFLEQFIEGYLFNDIENMLKIKLEDGKACGACGYPIMMTTLSGMELLGDLLSEKEIKARNIYGNKNFMNFWDNYFCQLNLKYKINKGGDIMRVLIRHGLAHRFLTLPGIFITINQPDSHWTISIAEKQIWIDAREFFIDFKNTYKKLVKIAIRDKSKMQKRLNEIMDLYEKDTTGLFKEAEDDLIFMYKNTKSTHDYTANTMGSPASGVCYSAYDSEIMELFNKKDK